MGQMLRGKDSWEKGELKLFSDSGIILKIGFHNIPLYMHKQSHLLKWVSVGFWL